MEARDYIADLIAKGLTQKQIEERTGIQQPTLSKILRGDVKDVLSAKYRALQSLHAHVAREGVDCAAADSAAVPTPAAEEAQS